MNVVDRVDVKHDRTHSANCSNGVTTSFKVKNSSNILLVTKTISLWFPFVNKGALVV